MRQQPPSWPPRPNAGLEVSAACPAIACSTGQIATTDSVTDVSHGEVINRICQQHLLCKD
eukprot:1153447-Pelagomonas_calceolata.AAC.12